MGKKGLVLGIANEHSLAYGCAQAFRALGAELAITYLNDKAKPFVEPLAIGLGAPIFLPCDVRVPGQLEAVRSHESNLGKARFLAPCHCLCPEGGSARPARRLFPRRLPAGHGHLPTRGFCSTSIMAAFPDGLHEMPRLQRRKKQFRHRPRASRSCIVQSPLLLRGNTPDGNPGSLPLKCIRLLARWTPDRARFRASGSSRIPFGGSQERARRYQL
jgi:Enoyl-(Acyl carrier protein) reductase